MDKILELLIRMLGWAFSRGGSTPQKEVAKEVMLPDNVRKFVCEEMERARAGQPWGANALGLPPELLIWIRAEITRQVNGRPDPTANNSLPPQLAQQFREQIQEKLRAT